MSDHSDELGTLTLPAAYISADGLYRYDLLRQWGGDEDGQVCWVMLNPSTADATLDDPTIRRCLGFSMAWGFGSLIVVNLFAWRSTDPKALLSAPDPIGPENDACIERAVRNADLTVCAWGTKGGLRNRAAKVTQALSGHDLHALDITKDGHPKHPLYVRGDTEPTLYRTASSDRQIPGDCDRCNGWHADGDTAQCDRNRAPYLDSSEASS